ncbi:MAG TPA: TIGR02679 family protein [Pseudogracilibacillus sp.]|nr:TIGR02679 family protein [Pseudogracilibacillus sp.]
MEKLLHEAVQFFKSEQAYHKLFLLFRKKYESLGRIGGTVPISTFTKEELADIGQFFGLPGELLAKKGTIALASFETQLERTRFSSISFKTLLDAYFGEVIISKKEQRQVKEEKLHNMLTEHQTKFPHIAFWLDYLLEQKRERRWIIQIAEMEPSYFTSLLAHLDRAFNNLPQEAERLPIFAQRIAGDPHAFDIQQDLGKIFIHLLSVHQGTLEAEKTVEIATSIEEINMLLQEYLIYRDDLLNFVTCANLVAATKEGIHPVWEAAAQHQTIQIVPLRELVSLEHVYPVKGRKVWMVENSGVCATLLDHEPHAPIVCTNGQFTLATLTLLDLLAKNDCKLYYASDFDPEGLGMAQRLLERYPNAIYLWHMDTAGYYQSSPTKEISNERLEKLKNITNDRLVEVAMEMKRIGKAGYQEALIPNMLSDIKEAI